MMVHYDSLRHDVCMSKAQPTHGMHAKLGRAHIWVGMYQFESNRVSLGPNKVGFGPGLCLG
jgi:hypothetical protein